MDPQFAPPAKNVPLLKSTYSDPNGGRMRPPPSRGTQQGLPRGTSRSQAQRKVSPTNSASGYSYAGSNNNHSTQYTTGALN